MIDAIAILKTLGYLGIFGVVFVETGLLVGFFLPGDSLLFMAGFLSSVDYFSLPTVMAVAFLGAILGEVTGYWLGVKYGHRIFNKQDSLFFHRDYIVKSQEFFKRHGGKAIILARFMPIVRTAVPVLAGVGNMDWKVFVFYNIIGGALWTIGLPVMGYYLGTVVPNADQYVLPIVCVVIVASALPTIISVLRDAQQRARLFAIVRKVLAR